MPCKSAQHAPRQALMPPLDLECRKWGFKRWGFKEIRGYLRKKAFFFRFLDFPGALRALRKRAKKGRKRAILADFGRFPGRAAWHPLSPQLLHPHLRQPNWYLVTHRRLRVISHLATNMQYLQDTRGNQILKNVAMQGLQFYHPILTQMMADEFHFQGAVKGTELGWQREPKTQIFAENRRFSQIHSLSWKFKHLEGAGNRRKPQICAGNRRLLQKTAGNRRLGSVTLSSALNFLWSQIQSNIAEADADVIPAPGQLELHGKCRCGVLLSPC